MSHQIAARSPTSPTSLRKKLALRIQACLTRTSSKTSSPTTTTTSRSRSRPRSDCGTTSNASTLTLIGSPTPSLLRPSTSSTTLTPSTLQIPTRSHILPNSPPSPSPTLLDEDLAHPHLTHLLTTHFPSHLASGLIKTLYPPTLRLSTLVSLAHAHLDARSQGIRACGKLVRAAGIHDDICVVIWDSLVPLAQEVEGLVEVLDGERFRGVAMEAFLAEMDGGEKGCIWCPEGLERGTCKGVVALGTGEEDMFEEGVVWEREERYVKKWGEPVDGYGMEGRPGVMKGLEEGEERVEVVEEVAMKGKEGRRSWFRPKGI